jgi:DNA-binding CsgD family transcriptional regulator
MTKVTIPAGFFDDQIEFFEFEGKSFAIHQGRAKSFFELPIVIQNQVWNLIDENTHMMLESQGYISREQKLDKFSMCRFGRLDNQADIVENSFYSEHYDCGFRGTCPMEGVVCTGIKFNGQILSIFELKMISLLATDHKTQVIAEKMGVCLNTLDAKKKIVFEKLGVMSRPKLIFIAATHNLLNPSYAME